MSDEEQLGKPDRDDDENVSWPAPRDDPPEEPSEPWARLKEERNERLAEEEERARGQ